MPNEIKYNGVTIASPPGGKTATIHCKGKKMSGDILVEFGLVSTTKVISDGSSITIEDAAVFEESEDTISIGG